MIPTRPMAVVALGGHALLPKGEKPTVAGQFRACQRAMRHMLVLFRRGWDVVLTHGNGPQVGNILLRSEIAAKKAYPIPLSVAVAESGGEIGYIIQQSLHNELRRSRLPHAVVTVLTQVLVDLNDPAFHMPTKPIGPFYTERQTGPLRKRGVPLAFADGYGWRRVVASPRPLRIVEADTVRRLAAQDVVVIAAGGGGIPVVERGGRLEGVDAVIDKDLASACLAVTLRAKLFIMLTDVRKAALWYNTPRQKDIDRMTAAQARRYLAEGHFPPGSMGPKVEAAADFAERTGCPALITTPEALKAALEERDGTRIVP
ncbi:MAG: carbamate kinase [Chloroflexota bacterium]